MNLHIKLKGGALYIAIIISILISVVLSLFIVLAYHNIQSVQVRASVTQLDLSLDSGFEMARSAYFPKNDQNRWQKMPFNTDSVSIKNLQWGCFQLIGVKAKNKHHRFQRTGLFGCLATPDTALMVAEQSRPIGLAGKIKFKGSCYLPKAGIKTAYIEGSSFSDLNSLRPFIKPSPNVIPEIDKEFLKGIELTQTELNAQTDSLVSSIPYSLNHSFYEKTVVVQQGSVNIRDQVLSNNIKIIAANTISVENGCQLTNVLLIARKIIFKKGFKGSVHAIARDTIITEDECEFNYPSSFCVYHSGTAKETDIPVNLISFGERCKFKGALLAVNKKDGKSKTFIRTNKQFECIGNVYSSDYAGIEGNMYGTIICKSLLLQTPSAVYENHLFNCLLDPKKYGSYLAVPDWFTVKQKKYTCAKWF